MFNIFEISIDTDYTDIGEYESIVKKNHLPILEERSFFLADPNSGSTCTSVFLVRIVYVFIINYIVWVMDRNVEIAELVSQHNSTGG